MLRYLSAGESHGPALTAIIEGLPAGMPLVVEYVDRQLARRQGGYGRGKRMSIEQDRVHLLAGVRGGVTLGTPVCLQIENKDWVNWRETMDPGTDARVDDRMVTRPRPGHADLTGVLKYGHRDVRNVLERASARETAIRVAVGTVGRRLLDKIGIKIVGFVRRIGQVEADVPELDPDVLQERTETSSVMCPNQVSSYKMMEHIDRTRDTGDSLGGVFEIRVYNLPPGLGSYVQWDRKLDGRLAGALMSIQAIKGVEIGAGFHGAACPGSEVQDEIFYDQDRGYYRQTNRAGGLEGGMTNGEPLVLRAAMKPIPTLRRPLRSVDIGTREAVEAAYERSDICAVPAACVIGEAVVAWELAVAAMEKFGGDTLFEFTGNWERYLASVKGG
ncbi:MAG: chorismate synthase [Desulforudis sp.]|nr:MAG: chorismate synthase [Desulforudis sp.]